MKHETALSLVMGDFCDTEFLIVEDTEDNGHYKHDSTDYYTVALRKSDNSYWMINFVMSYSYGLDEDSLHILEVEKVEVTRTEWKTKGKDYD